MADSSRLIAIVGAGISGLTLALALARNGVRSVVLERQPEIEEFGAGLQISANARKALNNIGLEKQLGDVSFLPEGINIYPFGADRPLITLKLGELARTKFGAPYAVMHRADLASSLYRECKKYPDIDVRFSVDKTEIIEDADGASVSFASDTEKPTTIKAFAVVGADGVGSNVRTNVLDGRTV